MKEDQDKNLAFLEECQREVIAAYEQKLQDASQDSRFHECHYQRYLEKVTGGRHLRTAAGITDLTGETFHIEIKRFNGWKGGMGQIQAYNRDTPRQELILYLFGKTPGSTQLLQEIVDTCGFHGITVKGFVEDTFEELVMPSPSSINPTPVHVEEDVCEKFKAECRAPDSAGRLKTSQIMTVFQEFCVQRGLEFEGRYKVLAKLDKKLGVEPNKRKYYDLQSRDMVAGYSGWKIIRGGCSGSDLIQLV